MQPNIHLTARRTQTKLQLATVKGPREATLESNVPENKETRLLRKTKKQEKRIERELFVYFFGKKQKKFFLGAK